MAESTVLPTIDRLPYYPEDTVSIIADPENHGVALALVRTKKNRRTKVADGYQIWACASTDIDRNGIPIYTGRNSRWTFVRDAHPCYDAALLNMVDPSGNNVAETDVQEPGKFATVDSLESVPHGAIAVFADPQCPGHALALVGKTDENKELHGHPATVDYYIWSCSAEASYEGVVKLSQDWYMLEHVGIRLGAAMMSLMKQAGYDGMMRF